tara:strand:+ start:251 stop:412 length:162 start_codon:yes stop_codon:yes gene_type:complete
MKELSLLTLLLLISCSSEKSEKKINFSSEMSFDEFKSKLEVYANNSDYPNITE